MNDKLICTTCKGEKVIRTPYNNSIKVDICPRCNGTGSLVNENDWKHNKGRRLIKGQKGIDRYDNQNRASRRMIETS